MLYWEQQRYFLRSPVPETGRREMPPDRQAPARARSAVGRGWTGERAHQGRAEAVAAMSIFVIAEIGVNHDGDLNKAKRLIDAAKAAGADAAKFQYFSSRKLWRDDRLKHLEFRFSEMVVLHHYCQQAGIEFMATPFGVEEVILLRQLVKRYKIASGCITRVPILDRKSVV